MVANQRERLIISDETLMPSAILWWYKRLFLRALINTSLLFLMALCSIKSSDSLCAFFFSFSPPSHHLIRISRGRSLSMNWDRKWSAPAAKPSPHSALLWPGLLMDRYNLFFPGPWSTPVIKNNHMYSEPTWWESCNYEGKISLTRWNCCLFLSCVSPSGIIVNFFCFPFLFLQTLFAGYTDNLIRVWQVTIGTR